MGRYMLCVVSERFGGLHYDIGECGSLKGATQEALRRILRLGDLGEITAFHLQKVDTKQ